MGELVLRDNNLNGRFGTILGRPDKRTLLHVETQFNAIMGQFLKAGTERYTINP